MHSNSRRSFMAKSGLALGTALWGGLANAQSQPPDLARLIVGFPPGGSTDVAARRLADRLSGSYAKTVIVDNRPGAGAQIAVSVLKSQVPDGTSLLISPGAPFSIYPYTYRTLPYTVDDVAPVCIVATYPFAFAVGPAVPASVGTLGDYLDWARRHPRQANYGSPAAGSPLHLVVELLARQSSTAMTHAAYRGDANGLQDLMGGQLSAYSTTLGSVLPHLKSNRIRLLAISGKQRSPFVPDLPTYVEQGYDIDLTEWFGLFAPAKTPRAAIERASGAADAAISDPGFGQAVADFGMTARFVDSAGLQAQLQADTRQWRSIVELIGFTADS